MPMKILLMLARACACTHAAKSTDEGAIFSVTISPAAPKKGDEVTVEASFMLSMFSVSQPLVY